MHAIEVARDVTGKPVIVYPNSGEDWDGEPPNVDRNSRGWSTELAPQWVAAGARIIGGCCRVRPGDIAELAAAVATSYAPPVRIESRYRPNRDRHRQPQGWR